MVTHKFAQAAGISYNQLAEATRKEGDSCYVGHSQAMVMGPDGKMQYGDVCDYEFDVAVRLEEIQLEGKKDWDNKDDRGRPARREYSERELAQERVKLMKVARQRCNTGARNRATLSVLGMQTGFKGLFTKDQRDESTKIFLFSRIIVNAKNELVAKAMLANLSGNTLALFGPPQASQGSVVPSSQSDPIQAEHEIIPSDESFGDDEPVDPREGLIRALRSIREKHDAILSIEAQTKIDAALADGAVPTERIQCLIRASEDFLARKGVAA